MINSVLSARSRTRKFTVTLQDSKTGKRYDVDIETMSGEAPTQDDLAGLQQQFEAQMSQKPQKPAKTPQKGVWTQTGGDMSLPEAQQALDLMNRVKGQRNQVVGDAVNAVNKQRLSKANVGAAVGSSIGKVKPEPQSYGSDPLAGLNPGGAFGGYSPPVRKMKTNEAAAMEGANLSNDVQAKTRAAIEDNPVSNFIAGLDPTDVLIPSWKKGLVGHLLGGVSGVANIPANIAGNVAVLYDPRASEDQQMKALGGIAWDVAGGAVTGKVLHEAGKLVKPVTTKVADAVKALVSRGVPKDIAVKAVDSVKENRLAMAPGTKPVEREGRPMWSHIDDQINQAYAVASNSGKPEDWAYFNDLIEQVPGVKAEAKPAAEPKPTGNTVDPSVSGNAYVAPETSASSNPVNPSEIPNSSPLETPPVGSVETPPTVEGPSGFARAFGDQAESTGVSVDQMAERGRELSDSGKVTPTHVYEKVKRGEALTGDDISVGIHRQRALRNRSNFLVNELGKADLDPATRALYEAELDGVIDETGLVQDTLRAARGTFHQAGQALQLGLNEDFSTANIIAKAKGWTRGQPLDDAVKANLTNLSQSLSKLEAEMTDLRNKVFETLKKGGKPVAKKNKDAIIASLRKDLGLGENAPVAGGGMKSKQSGAFNIPEGQEARVTRYVNTLARGYLEEGAANIDDVIKRFMQDVPGIDEDGVLSLLNGEYKKKLLTVDVHKQKINNALLKVKADAAYRQKNVWEKVIHTGTDSIISLQRSMQAGLDASFAFIQGLPTLLTSPKRWLKAWKPTGKVVKGGNEAFMMAQAELERRPMFGNAKKAGVAFSDLTGTYTSQEEALAGHLLEKARQSKIPGIRHYAEAASRSNEGYGTFLNDIRQGLFEDLVAGQTDNADLMRDMARLTNILTGRGDGKMAQALSNKHFAVALYAPRFMLSTFQNAYLPLLLPSFKTTAGKVAAMKTWGKQVGALWGGYELAKVVFGDENVDTDLKSANFGQITLPGGGTINPIKKIAMPITFVAQNFMGRISTNNKFNEPSFVNNAQLIGQTLMGKASPLGRLAINQATGSHMTDNGPEPFDLFTAKGLKDTASEMFLPLAGQQAAQDPQDMTHVVLTLLGMESNPKALAKKVTNRPPVKEGTFPAWVSDKTKQGRNAVRGRLGIPPDTH